MHYTLIFLLLFSTSYAQSINWKQIDQHTFEKWVLFQVNDLRDSLGLSTLSVDPILGKAASDQAYYQKKTNKVTHDQVTLNKESPSRRIAFYGGTHSLTGENCAMVSAKRYGKSYQRLARAFFLGWLNSPGHYANMVHPDYHTTGIRFSVNLKTGRAYATQVFGGVPYVPPKDNSSPRDAFGVSDPNNKACKRLEPFRHTAEELGSYLETRGDSIFIHFHDLAYLKRMLRHPNDGLALDFIEPRQLPCDGANVFHGSAVFDGVMRPPVYHYELFQLNRAQRKNRLVSFLGTIPKNLEANYQVNLLTIQERHLCRYSYPVDVPQRDIRDFELKPIWMLTSGEIIPDSIHAQAAHVVHFEKNVTTYEQEEFQNLLKEMGNLLPFLQKVHIHAYSSVEGDSAINMRLQQERAAQVKAYFTQLGIADSLISFESIESWDLFYEQIDSTEYGFLADLPQSEVKDLLKDPQFEEELSFYLAEQRRAMVEIEIAGRYDNQTPARYLAPAYYQLIEQKNVEQAWIVQSKIIRALGKVAEISAMGLLGKSFPDSLPFYPLINNQMAAMLTESGEIVPWTLGKSKLLWGETVHEWLTDSLVPLPMRYHLLRQEVKKLSDFANTDGFEAFRPNLTAEEIETAIVHLDDSLGWDRLGITDYRNFLSRLMINFHLAAVDYHYYKNNYRQKMRSMRAVRSYFLQSNVTESEAHRLALYFNRHQYYSWAIEVLEPWAKQETVRTNVLFDFIQTLILLRNDMEFKELNVYLNRLIDRDQALFCHWVDKYYQLRRTPELKALDCEICH